MLKYKLNTKFIRNDLVPIEIDEFSIEDVLGDRYKDKKMLVCHSTGDIPFDKDANIMSMYEQYMVNDDFISSTAYDFNTIYKPIAVNKDNRTFSIMFDKYYYLKASKTEIVEEETEPTEGEETPTVEGEKWWYIWFDGSHLFDTATNGIYKLYITFDGPDGYPDVIDENSTNGLAILYVGNTIGYTKTIGEGESAITITANAEVVTSSIIRVNYSTLHNFDGLENVMFFEEDGVEQSDLTRVGFFRDNFVFTDGMFGLYLDKAMATVKIPISQRFSTDLYQDEAISNNFIDAEVKKSINRITEMEKDIYHPVIWKTEDNNNYGSIKDEVYKIRFNLHFREHRGTDWIAEPDSFWNGVDSKTTDDLKFVEGVTQDDETVKYFKPYDGKEELQSDLLTYLNFNDKDVRYQKNKLKKSFLRVMFFDSMNPTNQNMLSYATIFMNSGNLFSKYARYIETDYFTKVNKNPVEEKTENSDVKKYKYTATVGLNGISSDREYQWDSVEKDKDKVEEKRLSSQIVVEDKYRSDASSEGFYLYLWKDNFLGTVPQDIYMKVEFNHAGYGRTIPFMSPYWDEKKDEENIEDETRKGFKPFSEILNDWKDGKGYGIRKYLKYSYIHFKYKYDAEHNRHVYYLDDELYGDSVYFDDNAITINLYEAKII